MQQRLSIKKIILKWPRASILSIYVLVTLSVLVPFYKLMPILLSYAPGVRQHPRLHAMMYGSSYGVQYWTIITISIIIHVIPLIFVFRGIGNWEILWQKTVSEDDLLTLKEIRNKCNNLPYSMILADILMPIVGVLGFGIFIFSTKYYNIHLLVNVVKLILLYSSILSTIAIVSFIFARRICKEILVNTDVDGSYPGFRVSFRSRLTLQMLLMFIVGIMITGLAGYAKLIEEKGDLLLKINSNKLYQVFNEKTVYPVALLRGMLGKIKLEEKKTVVFYLGPNDEEYTSDGIPLYKDFTMYLKYLSQDYHGKVHVLTGELQGASMKIITDKGPYWVGIKYLVVSEKMVSFFIVVFITLLLFNGGVFLYFAHSMSNDLSLITDNLNKITQGDTVDLDKRLPMVSNDEIGDLVAAFNNVQKMTKKHVEYIKKSEGILREQERLVSLGQMIGGIAHNLRTPIMSLSGGLEGVQELIHEYEHSIGNAAVTADDHRAIAKDMHEWIDKLKPYCSYMSDVISTVKDHSVVNNGHSTEDFTVQDLVKRIQILSSDRVRSNNCRLVFNVGIDDQTSIEGSITILLQVINNLIDNAVDAYSGKEGVVEVYICDCGESIQFKVKDSGEGIPEAIKRRLFKEMVTTKGKGGTGLGLYVSMARVISSFQGTIQCSSEEGNGTTMIVSIPRHREIVFEQVKV